MDWILVELNSNHKYEVEHIFAISVSVVYHSSTHSPRRISLELVQTIRTVQTVISHHTVAIVATVTSIQCLGYDIENIAASLWGKSSVWFLFFTGNRFRN
uniref:Uncharacterized protein n=1 Tax=Corethron hystrix TaxID=216773 RepID=A0A7S1BV23_9STRA